MPINHTLPFLLALALSTGAASAQCPPGSFDFGPALDPHPEMIVLGHYGPTDPLRPAAADYQRAVRDIALINAAISATIGQMHELMWEPNAITLNTTDPTHAELLCANQFYQANMTFICCGNWWRVEFPRAVNGLAAIEIYRAVPGVVSAELNVYGSIGGSGLCFDSWLYTVNAAGNWRWSITESHQAGFHGSPVCRSDGSWNVVTTPDGQITVLCYANCDESLAPQQLSAADFLCFLNRFAAGEGYANCDQSRGDPVHTANDFQCFLNRYAEGCP